MSGPTGGTTGARARSVRRPALEAYAVCPPGVEALCAAELTALGVRAVRPGRGGVTFRPTVRQLYAANLWLRTATRVLLRIGSFPAPSFAALEREAAQLDLEPWLGDRRPVLRVSASRSALYHTDAIAERLAKAWKVEPVDPHGDDDLADTDAQLFVVRNVGDEMTVSVDTSGVPLYKRGWRHEVAKAPLRENLAAAVLLASGWQPSQPLLDPFCGSGTIVIEAALLALGRPPGFLRSFAFFEWPSFEAGTWASVVGAAAESLHEPDEPLGLTGADRDAGAVAAATANAERAEVAEHVTFVERPVSATVSPGPVPGWVVTNPPYGARLDQAGDLRNLYARLGASLRGELAGWSVAMLVSDRRLAAHSGLSLHEALRTTNGGIDVVVLTGDGRAPQPDRRADRPSGGRSGQPSGRRRGRGPAGRSGGAADGRSADAPGRAPGPIG